MSHNPFNTSSKTNFWKKFKEENIFTNFTVMLVPHKSCKQPIHLKVPVGILLGSFFLIIILLCFTNYFAFSAFKLRQVAVENTRLNKISTEQEEQLVSLEQMADQIMHQLDEITEEEHNIREKIGTEDDTTGIGGVVENTVSTSNTSNSLLGDNILHERLSSLHCALEDFSDITAWHEQELEKLRSHIDDYNTELEKYNNFLTCMPTGWPLTGGEKETSLFGYRTDPFNKYRREFHTGYDLKCAYGAPIYAAGNGTVCKCGYRYGYGYTVEIDHGFGYHSLYAHCSSLKVKVGEQVCRGDLVALAGSTGRSTGTHLHIGVSYMGEWIDPKPLLHGDLSEIVIPDFKIDNTENKSLK